MTLTYGLARDFFDYCPFTGELRRRKTGKLVGSPDKDGYLRVEIKRKTYKVHRIIWLMVKGKWPGLRDIHHCDDDVQNNRISNLENLSPSYHHQRHVKETVKGYGYTPHVASPYQAWIRAKGKRIHLGRYKTANEAHQAYQQARTKYHNQEGRI